MIIYLDTSALVKLYVSEPGSELVKKQAEEAATVATSAVAYPETLSAFNRARREGRLSVRTFEKVEQNFKRDWEHYFQIQLDEQLIQQAGSYAVELDLRGFDSIHLASADLVEARADDFDFLCFDQRLTEAAQELDF